MTNVLFFPLLCEKDCTNYRMENKIQKEKLKCFNV